VRSELPTITTTDTAAHQFLTSTSPVWTSESSFQSSRVVRIDARQAAVSGPAEPEDGSAAPRFVVNGEDDFEHAAAAAIMVYDPNHPERPGWRSMCGAALVHRRDIQTAGHCIQFVEADLALGRTHAAWISFQQDPLAHFSADPAVADPRPADGTRSHRYTTIRTTSASSNCGNLTRQTSCCLGKVSRFRCDRAEGIREGHQADENGARTARSRRPHRTAGCGTDAPSCRLLIVTYGLQEFPVVTLPPVQVRQSALLRYRGSICLAGAIPQSARAGQGTTTPALVHRHARANAQTRSWIRS
jgi:hypothetical protein